MNHSVSFSIKPLPRYLLPAFLALFLTACHTSAPWPDSSKESFSAAQETLSISEDSPAEKNSEFAPLADDLSSAQYAIGDIILSDGSTVTETDLTELDQANLPVAVIAALNEDGTALAVGVHRSETPLPWATDESAGNTTKFTELISTQEYIAGQSLIFVGSTNGSDSWDIICSQDETDTADAARNYPAFHFINTYAASCRLTGEYASGWYMPAIAELYLIYQNRETINRSLQKIYQLDNGAAMDGLGTNWYWASSQADSQDDYAWFIHYFNGYAAECPKNFTNLHVLAVRTF